jgi:hypothetical protein
MVVESHHHDGARTARLAGVRIIGAVLILLGRKKKPLIGYVRD